MGADMPSDLMQNEKSRRIKALEFRVAQLEAVINNTPAKIYVKDLTGKFLFANTALANTVGLKVSELEGKHGFTFLAPRSAASHFENDLRVAELGLPLQIEEQNIESDGVHTYLSVKFPIRDSNGSISAVAGISTDITQRKLLERGLQETEIRWKSLFEQNVLGVAQIRIADGQFVLVNDRCCEMTGYSRQEMLNRKFQSITHPDDLAYDLDKLELLITGKLDRFMVQMRYIHKNGSTISINTTVIPLWGTGEPPEFLMVIAEDLTAQKQVEEQNLMLANEVRQERDKLAALINSISDEVWFMDMNAQLVLANVSAYREFQLEKGKPINLKEMFGKIRAVNLDGSPRLVENDPPLMAISGKEIRNQEEIIRTPRKGELRHRQISSSPVKDQDGNIIGAVSVIRDITEIKKAEERLRKSEEQMHLLAMELQDARENERTRIAREVHDVLAQDLTLLQLDIGALQRRLRHPVTDPEREKLLEITEKMKRLADSTVIAVQAIATELRPAILDSHGICAAIEWLASNFTKSTGFSCKVAVPEREPVLDSRQSTALFRIAQECLTNIIRHSSADRVDISFRVSGRNLILSVRDNGRGIAPDRIADPHSLGIIGIRERACALGGDVIYRSKPGEGTNVRVILPIGNKIIRGMQ
jgi:two-component system, NarL family, sensor histidine kinase UhpB